MSNIITLFSLIIGLIGIVVSIFFGLKNAKLTKEKMSIRWNDLENIAKNLCSRLEQQNFIPDIIYTFGNECGTIISLIEKHFYNRNIITFIGTTRRKENRLRDTPDKQYYTKAETFSWELYIPNELLKYKDKKILVVDSIAITGNFIATMRKLFMDNDFVTSNVKVACIVTTKSAIENNSAPDYYDKTIDESYFYFPWGKVT